MSKILNAEGPSIRTANQWRVVNNEEELCVLLLLTLTLY